MNESKSGREQRLAEALRANLRRRKGQARELAKEEGPVAPVRDDDADEGVEGRR